MSKNDTDGNRDASVNRRTALRIAGGLATSGVVGLAGCSGGGDGGGGGGDGGSGGDNGSDSGSGGGESDGGDTSSDGTATAAEPTTVVHGAVKGGTTGVLVNVMNDQGFDEDRGTSVQPEFFTSPPKVQKQIVLNEDIPTGFMGSIVATRLHAKGNKPRLVGPYMLYHMYVLTRNDSDISGPADLEGAKISWASEAADAWLKFEVILNEDVGITPDQLEFVQTAPPASINLLEKGELDAILLNEPLVTKALSGFDFEVVYSPREVWDELEGKPLTTVDLAWNDPWYQENQEAGKALAQATLDAQKFLQSNIDSAIDTYTDAFGLENDDQISLAKERLNRVYPTEWNRDAFVESELSVVRKGQELGLVDSDPTEEIFTWVL